MTPVERYNELSGEREPWLRRAKQFAIWSCPGLLAGMNGSRSGTETEELRHDWQSVGTRGVVNLVNKMSMALFPPSQPFFQFTSNTQEEATALAKAEKVAMSKFNDSNIREKLYEILTQLIVVGDVVLRYDAKGDAVAYNLSQYVKRLDNAGRLMELIIKEIMEWDELPDNVKTEKTEDALELYTWVTRKGEKYEVRQFLGEEQVGRPLTYTEDTLPFIHEEWSLVNQESYGRSRVETYSGDFAALSSTSWAKATLIAIIADIRVLVGDGVNIDTYMDGKPGDAIPGKEGDLYCYTPEVEKALAVVTAAVKDLEKGINLAFLVGSGAVRDAERVTAAEIMWQAQELENTLGEVYTRLGNTLQRPIAKRLLGSLNKDLAKQSILILTGMRALSRMNQMEKWKALIRDLGETASLPEQAQDWVNFGKLIEVLAVGYGLDTAGVLRSEEEYAQLIEQRQQFEKEMKNGE
jgi:hypothetical protein